MDHLYRHMCKQLELEEKFIIGGDFNITPYVIDVHREIFDESICCSLQERKALRKILNAGYIDGFRKCHVDEKAFSWWDYRGGAWKNNKGLRIDNILLSPNLGYNLINSYILSDMRSHEKPSDHVPVIVECRC